MADRPILFSAPMINAMLAGRKWQTRRLLKLPTKTHSGGPIYERPDMGGWEATTHGGAGCFIIGPGGERQPIPERAGVWHQTTGVCVATKFAVGDRLYVREEWKSTPAYDDLKPSDMGGDNPIYYPADGATFNWAEADGEMLGRRRPGMHMPRWASRLTLIVEAVRVERLQAISEADAIAEGVTCWVCGGRVDGTSEEECACFHSQSAAIPSYQVLWNSLHDKTGERWDDNPFVVAVSFRIVRGNIDQVPA